MSYASLHAAPRPLTQKKEWAIDALRDSRGVRLSSAPHSAALFPPR